MRNLPASVRMLLLPTGLLALIVAATFLIPAPVLAKPEMTQQGSSWVLTTTVQINEHVYAYSSQAKAKCRVVQSSRMRLDDELTMPLLNSDRSVNGVTYRPLGSFAGERTGTTVTMSCSTNDIMIAFQPKFGETFVAMMRIGAALVIAFLVVIAIIGRPTGLRSR